MSTEPEQTEDDFQKELIDLFGQEAQEWLLQIHSALTELESQVSGDRHAQLVDAIVRGITSLGGSAATVSLSEVERTTFALLPFIDTIKDRTTAAKQDYATVREQFRLVVASVTTATGIELDLGPAAEAAPQQDPTSDLLTLLNALRDLEDREAAAHRVTRSLIPQVMRRLEQEARQGSGQISAKEYQQILLDTQAADEQYLLSVQQELPAIAHYLGRLRQEGMGALDSGSALDATIRQLESLHNGVKQANATPMVTFLNGLQSFLSILAQRRPTLASQRLEAVEARIRSVLTLAQEWAATGRSERDAMSQLLPAA